MIVLVDTTVWIDFFHGRPEPHVEVLENLLRNNEDVCSCGFVLTEVLQGIRNDAQYRKTKDYFEALILLPARKQTFVRAAEIYRLLRKKGITIRKAVDCMIASVAIEHDVPLLHNDSDFDQIAKHTKLKVVKTKKKTG